MLRSRAHLGAALLGIWLASAPGIGRSDPPAVPLYPLEAFFGDADVAHAQISPSGKQVAALQPVDGYPNVVLIDIETHQVTPVTQLRERIEDFWWASDERILFNTVKRGGRYRRLNAINADGTRLKKFELPDFLVSLLPNDDRHVLVAEAYASSPRRITSRVMRLNIYSGAARVWASASRAAKRWIADADGHVRLAYGESGAEGYFLYRRAQGEPWVDVGPTERFPLDAMTFVPLGFTNDPRKIYVSARIDSDRFAIHEFDIESRRFSPPIFSHPHYDVTGPLRFSTGEDGVRKLVAIEYQADYQETHWVDGGWREMMKEIHQALPGRVAYVLGTSSDGGVILLLVISDRHPGTYYVHRPTEGMLVPFVDRRPQLDPQHMVEVRPVQYRARDGLLIPGYLALPRGSEGKRVPVIVNPHGGPWVRDDREFDPVLQFFANRGWAVFRPNFRGSTGFGLTFQKMGYRQWGKAMQQDITDGVRWLIDQGIADPGRICIYGTSYGGYAALLGAVESPDLYRCAASYAAATDLAELLSDRNQREDNQLWTRLIGDRKEDRERLRLASPVHRASAIRIPVLMAHGKEDRVIRASHTREMARALSRSGRLEELMLFDDEGHGLHHERNRLEYYGRLEQFMARHLGAPRAARTASSPPAPAPAPVYTPVGGQ